MPTCLICLNVLRNPAALPCGEYHCSFVYSSGRSCDATGHVFCYDCIVKVVRNVEPFTKQHLCPTCQVPYTICTSNPSFTMHLSSDNLSLLASVDPQLVPAHLRLHLTPAIRKLNLDYTLSSQIPNATPSAECDRLRAENASLRSCCEVWRKRAALHASASLGLVGLARLARDHAIRVRKEQAQLQERCVALKRKCDALE